MISHIVRNVTLGSLGTLVALEGYYGYERADGLKA